MESLNKATFRTYDAKDALPEMFPKVRHISNYVTNHICGVYPLSNLFKF